MGRDAERDAFGAALAAPALPFAVLYVHGPGGVGKTWLLRQFEALAESAGALVLTLDARNIEASAAGFVAAFRAAVAAALPDVPVEVGDLRAAWRAVKSAGRRVVLTLDTYELLDTLDGFMRDTFLADMPDDVLVVFAGRKPPSAGWRGDPAWHALMRGVPLRNLSPREGAAYLERRNVPEEFRAVALAFTHGHPLALSLVAETYAQRGTLNHLSIEGAPDIVKTLLDSFVQKVPGPAHRAALEACAMVRMLTESLLSRMLNVADSHELFDWLRGLSFIDVSRHGLFPHDLARDAISADVRWRNPDWYAELHKRARAYYVSRLSQSQDIEQQRAIFDFTFLHRDNVVVRQFFDWQESGNTRVEPLRAEDASAVRAAIARDEGAHAANAADYWLERHPQTAHGLREGERLVGYFIRVPLHAVDEADMRADAVVERAWRHLREQAPLRPGEVSGFFRFWGAIDGHQQVSPIQSLIFIAAVQFYLTTPRLACTLFHCIDPDFWNMLFVYADLDRLPDQDYSAEERQFGVFFHDWRKRPPAAWLDLLAEREMSLNPPVAPAPRAQQQQVIALSESEFTEALRDALKAMARSNTLRGNPLLGSRLVSDASGVSAGEAERVLALRKLITDAAHLLNTAPRDAKFYRAFHHTYLQPAASQEAAAELIDVPFSTYRRHLQTAVERLTAELWSRELGS